MRKPNSPNQQSMSIGDASGIALNCLLTAMDESDDEVIIKLRSAFHRKFYEALVINTRGLMDQGIATGNQQAIQLAYHQAANIKAMIRERGVFITEETNSVLESMIKEAII